MSTCRGCGSPIEWARTATGGRIPLSEVMFLAAEVRTFGLEVPEQLPPAHRYDVAEGRAVKAPLGRFVSHFVVCPKRAKFSGKGRAQ